MEDGDLERIVRQINVEHAECLFPRDLEMIKVWMGCVSWHFSMLNHAREPDGAMAFPSPPQNNVREHHGSLEAFNCALKLQLLLDPLSYKASRCFASICLALLGISPFNVPSALRGIISRLTSSSC